MRYAKVKEQQNCGGAGIMLDVFKFVLIGSVSNSCF